MPMSSAAGSVRGLEKKEHRLATVNRILCWVLPLVAVGAVGDLLRWGVEIRRPVESAAPDLKELDRSLPTVPSLEFPAELFKPLHPLEPKDSEAEGPSVAVEEAQWKLMGVSLGSSKRAFLQDPKTGKGVWVSEGEKIGPSLVKEIMEKSVLLETEGKSYEIRL